MASTVSQLEKPGHLPPQVRSSRPAGFFSRSVAFVLDLVILNIVLLGGSALIQAFLSFFRLTGLVDSIKTALEYSTYNIVIESVLITLIVIGYFTLFWTLVGFTPGKAILGLKVVRKNGAKASFGRSILRFFAYWISAIPLFLGFLWVLWDPKRQGWHDKIAGTQVLYISKKTHKQTHQ
jgi:uncharacterized RDD family membrane protein YckC